MNSNKKIWLILIAALGNMIAPFSIDTYLPSFPAIESYYDVSREIMTTTMGAYLAAFAITTLVWGPLADRFGRKAIAITSLIGFALVSAGCALSPSFDYFMTFRILQGVFAGGVIIAGRAMIRDAFPPKEAQKAMALIMMVFAIAPAIAPIIGGFLQHHYDWESIFWFLTAYGIITFLLILLFLKETQAAEHVQSIAPKKLISSYVHSLKHPVFIRVVLAQSFVFGGFFVYVVGSASLIFDHLHLGAEDFWIQFVPMVGGMMLGSFFSHRVSNHKTPIEMANIAFAIGGIAVVTNLILELFTEPQVMTVIPQLSLYAFGLSFALPVLSILALDCLPEKRGMAASLQSLMQMGMMALVSILVVPLVHASLLEMAISMASLWFLGWLLWLNVHRRLPRQAEQIHEF
ncbi:multidrug effflux MFS transporter [Thiomicrorhabdus sp. ZW0627]|uniref:multidrug effflux MFS transporter n=1 Tax=Thiomicrorhabdus sp. ZW0627 TaxID=3039774 RepID=UPI0024372C6E|nr:multidrug effflux MFS transporter [Thiomicrorhabdus sp. ZW0627]MDG6773151.1 multidrug effflux MFS transporter [Thiomicrorhabdus sp. ZW0627]